MEDQIERKILSEEDKKSRNKRSIVDFNNVKKELTANKLREGASNEMTNVNNFPDSERTQGENRETRNSIFGLKVKKRKPIVNFGDFGIQGKFRKRGDKIISINQFPRTERLMAPKALKHERRRKSKTRSEDKEEIDQDKKRSKTLIDSKTRKHRHKKHYQI